MRHPSVTKLLNHLVLEQKKKSPLLVGVVGSMGIGKTTFCAHLKEALAEALPECTISSVSTDGFIYPNEFLKKEGLMDYKGFPHSFDNELYLGFVKDLRANEQMLYVLPYYSQTLKDIDPFSSQKIPKSDIYLLEGINLFFPLENDEHFSLKKYYDEVVFLSMPEKDIAHQNSLRFDEALKQARISESPYFSTLIEAKDDEIEKYKDHLFKMIHLPFTRKYIAPYKEQATFVMPLKHEEPFKGTLPGFF